MTLKKVSFGTTRIQKLRRVTLDQNLLQTLGLSIGDLVCIELDTENEAVLITRAPESDSVQEGVHSTPRRSRAKR